MTTPSVNETSRYDLADLADVLFASPLQESDHPTPAQVRTVIAQQLDACHGDCSTCAGCVAQEAGDHPEQYMNRMRWALRAVRRAYPSSGLPRAS
jgi:hypothetical protein